MQIAVTLVSKVCPSVCAIQEPAAVFTRITDLQVASLQFGNMLASLECLRQNANFEQCLKQQLQATIPDLDHVCTCCFSSRTLPVAVECLKYLDGTSQSNRKAVCDVLCNRALALLHHTPPLAQAALQDSTSAVQTESTTSKVCQAAEHANFVA